MKKIVQILSITLISSMTFACNADEKTNEKIEKTPEKKEEVTQKLENQNEDTIVSTIEKVPVDRKNLKGFWREFKQLVQFKDKEGLKELFSDDYSGIVSGLYTLEDYSSRIAKSSLEDLKGSEEEGMYEFVMDLSEGAEDGSATTIYMKKNKDGDFEIFSIIEAG